MSFEQVDVTERRVVIEGGLVKVIHVAVQGPGGPEGPPGSGSITATPPLAYDSGTDTVSIQPGDNPGDVLRWSGTAWERTPLDFGDLAGIPGSFPPMPHAHAIADVTGLQGELDGKAAASHGHALGDLAQSGASNGQVPIWNGSAWVPGAAGAPPGGAGTELQYRAGASSFGAVTGSSWNGSILTLPDLAVAPSSGRVYLDATTDPTARTYIRANTTGYLLEFWNRYSSVFAAAVLGGGGLALPNFAGIAFRSIGAGPTNSACPVIKPQDTNPISLNTDGATVPLWICSLYGGPYTTGLRHATDLSFALGQGGNPPSGTVTGGNAGKLNIYLREGGTGSGGAAAGSDGAVKFWKGSSPTETLVIGLDGWLEGVAQTTPAAPAAGRGRLYYDTSGGKVRLMARFPSGAAQLIATEP